jgi:mannosyltransferase
VVAAVSRGGARIAPVALAGAVCIAAINFFVGLGSSSLFIDEALSWGAAAGPVGDVLDRVRAVEITPPLYYLGLHEWIGRGSDGEAFMRLPSALAGVALVAAVFWVAWRVAGRRAGALAAVLCALSPFVMEYAQQARAYVFAMLACTVAVGAAIELERTSEQGRRRLWLIALVIASIVAIWVHYTAALIVVILIVLLWRRRTLGRRELVVLSVPVVAGMLGLLPFLTDQLGHGNEQGVAPFAHLTAENIVKAIGTPWEGRARGAYRMVPIGLAAAGMVIAAVIALRRRSEPGDDLLRGVVLPLAVAPVALIVVVTVLGPDVLITRYSAVAAPFLIVVLAAVATSARRPVGVALVVVALGAAAAGSIAAHVPAGHYPNVRSATERIAAGVRPSDGVLLAGDVAYGDLFNYYAIRTGLPPLAVARDREPATLGLLKGRPRLWFMGAPPPRADLLRAGLKALSFDPVATWRYRGSPQLELTLSRHPGR